MKEFFPEIIDYEFTASMESKLDSIEHKENTIEGVLSEFYTSFEEELARAIRAAEKNDKIAVPDEESDVKCALCGAKMVYKSGRYGKFLACPNFPECRYTVALDKDGKPQKNESAAPKLAGFKCELCGGDMVVRTGRYGVFYACINYPTCKFSKQKVTHLGIPCPLCSADIVARHGKGKNVFYSCERSPECGFSSWDMPLKERCPDCGDMLYYKKNRKSVICKNPSCDYTREEEMAVIE